MIHLIGLVGSLRKESINRIAFNALKSFSPEGVQWSDAEISDIPLYNADLPTPQSVERLTAQIREADGLILVTPEFNYGIPGVLKNALDWASRPAYKSVLAGKPTTLLGASPGPTGTARAQGQLKQVILGVAGHLYPSPEVTLGSFPSKVDDTGAITDPATEKSLRRLIEGFAAWTATQKTSTPQG